MRIKEITLTGGIVSNSAQISRNGLMGLCIILKTGKQIKVKLIIKKADLDKLRNAAERIQVHCDGYFGTNSDIHDYYEMLERIS